MLLPSRSTLSPMVEPLPRPMGCLAQPSSRRYALGAELASWAYVGTADSATAATAIPHNHFTRSVLRMRILPVENSWRYVLGGTRVGWVEPPGLALGRPDDKLRETHRSHADTP